MKAIICTNYGGPEVLKLADIPKPTISDNQVLVRVVSTAVNSGDVRVRGLVVPGFLRIVMRLVLGVRRPRKPILGVVFSGVVESVGAEVTRFKQGDEVFAMTGFKFGAYAEYIALSEKSMMSLKPINASFNEAAAIVFGGATAVYFLQKAGIEKIVNPSVLIYGATGSVGSAAIQIAHSYGAKVTAVCGESGVELVKKLGADSVIVYTAQDFTTLLTKFDIVFDAVGKTTKKQCAHLLKKGGVYKTVGGLETAGEKVEQLHLVKSLYEAGRYQATIDRVYPLTEMVAAHTYVDTGTKKGNVVIEVG
jgi:NADPH:quinone reductase-like Zn-dependent oxidoreductase